MKFEITTQELKKGISVASHATASISTTPILENILIKVNFKNIVLTANNLEMAIEYVIDTGIHIISEGSFCIPSRLFSGYVNLLEDEKILIELTPNGALELKHVSGNTKIKGVPAEDFPLIPNIKEDNRFTFSGKILKRSIEKTLISVAEGNIRPNLAGVYFHISQNQAILASTDSFRLTEYTTTHNASGDVDFKQVIPSKTCHEIKNLIEDDKQVEIICGDNQIAFSFDKIKVFSRLLNGKFPEGYTEFFPKEFTTRAVINRVDLIMALKKINLISRDNNYSIKMSFSFYNGVHIEAMETHRGFGEDRIMASIEGEDAIIGMNSIYLLDVLGIIETTHVSIQFQSSLSPALILPVPDEGKKVDDSEVFRHIIMPIKI